MKFLKDWLQLLKDDHFQQDLVFFLIIIILYICNVVETKSFEVLATVIIAGDAVKKLGRGK